MGLSADIRTARAHLASARGEEVDALIKTLRRSRMVGVLGDGDVGKTATIQQAVTTARLAAVNVDFNAVASEEHAAFLLARSLARTTLGVVPMSLLRSEALLPEYVLRARGALAEKVGLAVLDEALLDWPSGTLSWNAALEALGRLGRDRELVLWLDHLEAPNLTPRHPVDVDRLLWGVRDLHQRLPSLRLVLSANIAMDRRLLDDQAAFHQSGEWITLANPTLAIWIRVARKLDVAASLASELVDLTAGHPDTMLRGLLEARTDDEPGDARSVLYEIAMRDDGLSAHVSQHARTLHRLGGQLMQQIAMGQQPYGKPQRGAIGDQELAKVLDRLRMAGLLCRRAKWEIVHPLLALRLQGDGREPATTESRLEPREILDWLDAGGEPELVSDSVVTLLRQTAEKSETQLVISAWLNAGGEPGVVRESMTAWLGEYAADPAAQYVFNAWLRSGGDLDLVRDCVVTWLADHGADHRASFVFDAWLNAGGPMDVVWRPALAWMAQHGADSNASFVYVALLKAGGDLESISAPLGTWLEAHQVSPPASYVYQAWCDAGGSLQFVEHPMREWLTWHATKPSAGFVYEAWLAAGGRPHVVEEAMNGWLDKNGRTLAAGQIYAAWLKAGGASLYVRANLEAWLRDWENHPSAASVRSMVA